VVPGQEEGPTGLVCTELQHLGERGVEHGSGFLHGIGKSFPTESVMHAGGELRLEDAGKKMLKV